tara:strand:- start:330756 stop:331400 length:645 start_codon:yes stop_codon:yes gene_type:complete
MYKYSAETIQNIIQLRKSGKSIPEIESLTNVPRATVWRYTKDVILNDHASARIKKRRGLSTERASKRKVEAQKAAKRILGTSLSKKEKYLLLLGLYWGEGTKRELSFINSDSYMLKVFVELLKDLGISSNRFIVTIRVHENIDKQKAAKFWLNVLNLPKSNLHSIYIIPAGNKSNLEYGMCRVRVKKNIEEFLLIMEGIENLKNSYSRHSVAIV